jgi:hypothetical protein
MDAYRKHFAAAETYGARARAHRARAERHRSLAFGGPEGADAEQVERYDDGESTAEWLMRMQYNEANDDNKREETARRLVGMMMPWVPPRLGGFEDNVESTNNTDINWMFKRSNHDCVGRRDDGSITGGRIDVSELQKYENLPYALLPRHIQYGVLQKPSYVVALEKSG